MTGSNRFKVGDLVEANREGGWSPGRVIKVGGQAMKVAESVACVHTTVGNIHHIAWRYDIEYHMSLCHFVSVVLSFIILH